LPQRIILMTALRCTSIDPEVNRNNMDFRLGIEKSG